MTEFIAKNGNGFAKHSNKIIHGLSAASLVYLYSVFPSRHEFELLRQRQAESWIAIQNIQNILMQRVDGTNTIDTGLGQE